MDSQELAVKRSRENEEEENEIGSGNSRRRLEADENCENNLPVVKMTKDKGKGKGTRPRPDVDNVSKNEDSNISKEVRSHDRFVYIKSEMKDVPMSKANPFRVTEAIQKVVGGDVKKIKPLRSGDLLVETLNSDQIKRLCQLKKIGEMPVKVSVAKQYNIAKGVIYAPCLFDMTEEEVVRELIEYKVTEARFMKKGPMKRKTPLILLTFASSIIPLEIKCGYLNVRVDKYIPPPLRCYNCNGFGHTAKVCKSKLSCTKCDEEHERDECINLDFRCSNCKSKEHGALDKTCPVYIRERDIINIKVNENISYFEARKRYEQKSYASVADKDNGSGRNVVNEVSKNVSRMDVVPVSQQRGGEGQSFGIGVNEEASTSGANVNEMVVNVSEIGLESGDVNKNISDNTSEEQREVQMISLIVNIIKIANRNPGKTTIQARQISNLLFKVMNKKIDVATLIKVLE